MQYDEVNKEYYNLLEKLIVIGKEMAEKENTELGKQYLTIYKEMEELLNNFINNWNPLDEENPVTYTDNLKTIKDNL